MDQITNETNEKLETVDKVCADDEIESTVQNVAALPLAVMCDEEQEKQQKIEIDRVKFLTSYFNIPIKSLLELLKSKPK